MDSLKLTNFFYPKVANTLDKKEFVKSIEISFEHQESFGNENIRVTYEVSLNEKFDTLSIDQKDKVSESFLGSRNYIFTLRTANERQSKEIFVRLIEFKHIYISLTSYIAEQLESELGKEIPIRIESLDHWPLLSYCEKFFRYLYKEYGDYRYLIDSNYKKDVRQFEALYKLSNRSKKVYLENPEQFEFSDQYLTYICSVSVDQIREIIIKYKVPIRAEGGKTIDNIRIRSIDFLKAIKAETRRLRRLGRDWYEDRITQFESILLALYDEYFYSEKLSLLSAQQENYIKKFSVRPGHIIQLQDDRFVMVDSISFRDELDLVVKYSILKKNLEKGTRTRSVELKQVKYFLQTKYFREYKNQNVILRIKPFMNWAKKKKKALKYDNFTLDLAVESIH